MIVVDANIIAYLHLPGENTAAAERLMEKDYEWSAPTVWRSELRNVLAGYLRRGDLLLQEAQAIQSEAEELMAENEYEVHSNAILELVDRSHCSAYDCEYVALAMHLGVRLVTMDRALLRAFPRVALALPSAEGLES